LANFRRHLACVLTRFDFYPSRPRTGQRPRLSEVAQFARVTRERAQTMKVFIVEVLVQSAASAS
jgi:hypothetical protein